MLDSEDTHDADTRVLLRSQRCYASHQHLGTIVYEMPSLYRIAVLLCPLLGIAQASSIPTAHKVKENVDVPRGWVKYGEPPANHKVALKIALPQPNFNELERHLYEVSDPDHVRYGQHLSKEEVEELVAPHPETLDAVNEWLSSLGFTDEDMVRSPAKDWITIIVPLGKAEAMLDTVRNFLLECTYPSFIWL